MSKLHVEEIFSSCMIITCWKKHQYIWLAIGFRFFVWNPFMCWFCSFLWLPEKKVRLSFIIKHFYEQSWFLFNLIKSLVVFYYFWRSQLDWQCFNDNVLWCEVFRCGTCLFKPSSLCHICHPFFPLTFIITPEKSGLQRRVFLWFMTRQKTTVIEHYITVYQGKSKQHRASLQRHEIEQRVHTQASVTASIRGWTCTGGMVVWVWRVTERNDCILKGAHVCLAVSLRLVWLP